MSRNNDNADDVILHTFFAKEQCQTQTVDIFNLPEADLTAIRVLIPSIGHDLFVSRKDLVYF